MITLSTFSFQENQNLGPQNEDDAEVHVDNTADI